jgi:hypothetical protein
MKHLGASIFLILCTVLCCSCTNIRDKKITEENKAKVMEEAGKKLTPEELTLLEGYVMRQSMQQAIANAFPAISADKNPADKTIGQMIEEQRKWANGQGEEDQKEKHLAAGVAAKQAEMRNVIGVALLSYSIKKGPLDSGALDSADVGYAYENRSGKDVRAFEGKVVFIDVLGNKLEEVPLKVLTPLKAGGKASVTDELMFDPYEELRDKKLADLKVEWKPKKILFTDGSSVEVGGSPDE